MCIEYWRESSQLNIKIYKSTLCVGHTVCSAKQSSYLNLKIDLS